MNARNWDTETADKCKLPELIPEICDGCRDYAYCHRQLTLEDFMRGDEMIYPQVDGITSSII